MTDRIDPIAAARALIEPLTGYTPGPWDASGLTVYDTCMDGVASCHAGADARLIAAAPDLKATLATALDEIDRLREALEVENLGLRDSRNYFKAQALNAKSRVDRLRKRKAALMAALLEINACDDLREAKFIARIGHDSWEDDELIHRNRGRIHAARSGDHLQDRLIAERDDARAQVAAAYEAAACVTVDMGPQYDGRSVHYHIPEMAKGAIRALTPADAQATLDKMLAEARLEGWRAGRDAATEPLTSLAAVLRKSENSYHQSQASAMLERADAIRALPEPKEASHD